MKCKQIYLSVSRIHSSSDIHKSTHTHIFIYKSEYLKLVRDNVTSTYEIAPPDIEKQINKEAKIILRCA